MEVVTLLDFYLDFESIEGNHKNHKTNLVKRTQVMMLMKTDRLIITPGAPIGIM